MKKNTFIFGLVFSVFFVKAQCDTIANFCYNNNFTINYVSDGQNYRAFLNNDDQAEFETTFFGGSTYRIAACTGFQQGNLIFKIKDELGNILFDSMDFENVPFWDFKVDYTITVKVLAQLDELEVKSGCAAVLIAFKK